MGLLRSAFIPDCSYLELARSPQASMTVTMTASMSDLAERRWTVAR
jgi:hypothetical protein